MKAKYLIKFQPCLHEVLMTWSEMHPFSAMYSTFGSGHSEHCPECKRVKAEEVIRRMEMGLGIQ